ncbi:MAG TPA: DUF2793 domain-containing protein [Sphingomonadaceae bacterium]|nr:DUF2793 domain-containing protein [Sphingomonadaceae bacterium]
MLAGQSQKEFYVNEAHARIDALLHAAIEGIANDPPASPVEGECWLVDASPAGDWSANAGEIACYEAGNWVFVSPRDGLRLLDRSTGQFLLYRAGWTAASAPAAPAGGTTVDSEARTAIGELIAALSDAGILPG